MGKSNGDTIQTRDDRQQIIKQTEEYNQLMQADHAAGKMIRKMQADVRDEKGQNEDNKEEAEEKIGKYLANHNEGKEENEYLVRGAELECGCGSHPRKLNLRTCHGVYTNGHALVHELDCIQGEEENITWFGVCEKSEGLDTDIIVIEDDNGRVCGKKCEPHIVGTWLDTCDKTRIAESGGIGAQSYATLTVGSFLVCRQGGIITPRNSGQGRKIEVDEFAGKQKAYDRVKGLDHM